jgi:hypothetical protein
MLRLLLQLLQLLQKFSVQLAVEKIKHKMMLGGIFEKSK